MRLHPDLHDIPWAHDNGESAETAVALICDHQSFRALRGAGPGALNVGCHCLFEHHVSHHEFIYCLNPAPIGPYLK